MPAARALTTGQAGSGWVSGTPGASTSAAKPCQSAMRRSSTGDAGGLGAAATASASSSHAATLRAAGGQRQRGGAAAGAEAEDGDVLAGKGGDGDHAALT